jgi:hypothetical protein
MSSVCRFLLIVGFWVLAGAAQAGAFLLGEGEAQLITSGRFSGAAIEFDARGRVRPLPAYRKFELTARAEYGLTRDLTLIFQAAGEHVRSRAALGARESGLTVSEIGARARLANPGDAVVSAQIVGLAPGTLGRIGFDEARRAGFDARLLVGTPFTAFGVAGFAGLEGAYRARGGGLSEWRVETTLGWRFSERWLVLTQAYFAAGRESAVSHRNFLRLKSEMSAVFRINSRWSMQLGVGATTFGRNCAREAGPFAAVWARF